MDPLDEARLIDAIKQTGNIHIAASDLGLDIDVISSAIESDELLQRKLKDAKAYHSAVLEREILRRGYEGYEHIRAVDMEDPKNPQIVTETQYSDFLALAYMKAHNPIYRGQEDTSLEPSPIVFVGPQADTEAEWRKLARGGSADGL